MTDDGAPRGVDFHNHVLPGVDDGAGELEQAVRAVRSLLDEDVGTVIATPHLPASLLERPERAAQRLSLFDRAYVQLQDALDLQEIPVRLERGAEVRLDSPDPDLSDPRVRLAGTRFVLVEFSNFTMPPFGGRQLEAVRDVGYTPILAHPERYSGGATQLERFGRWRERGAFLQVNAGSLSGQYGDGARRVARSLLERGWVDYLSSDYHARGEPGIVPVREALGRARLAPERASGDTDRGVEPGTAPGPEPTEIGGRGRGDGDAVAGEGADENPKEADVAVAEEVAVEEAVRRLLCTNGARLLEGVDPLPVAPLTFGRGVWDRVRSLLG